jgi:DNA-binding response OmpR family regulator
MTTVMQKEGDIATVLVIDDEILVRFAIADYLRECGYRVLEAASGGEGMIIVEAAGVRMDVVLCSATLSGSPNAFEVAFAVRAKRPGIPVILAGSPEKAAGAAATLCDQGPNLTRPYDPSLVSDRIKRLLASRGSAVAGAASALTARLPSKAPSAGRGVI